MRGSDIAQLLPPCSPMTPGCLQQREAAILQLVRQGAYVANWVPLVIDVPPYRATIYVMNDALMLGEPGDAFRIGVTAQLQQQIADELDAVLLTPKLVDDIQRQAQITIDPPVTLGGSPEMGSTAWMLKHHNAVEARIAKIIASMGLSDLDTSDMLLSNIGKHWVNSPYVSNQGPVLDCGPSGKHKPIPNSFAAENYGWFVSSRFTGGRYPAGTNSVTAIPGLNIWQTPGLCHNYGHADYCVAPETRVLRADLRWVPAGELSVGDELVGFDEDVTKGRDCRYRAAAVVRAERKQLECVEITTELGTVVASLDHRWVAQRFPYRKSRNGSVPSAWMWKRTEDLAIGDVLGAMVKPWDVDQSREGGWMAGILDGEGWVSPPTGVGVGQKPGIVLDAIASKLRNDGFDVAASINKVGGVVRLMCRGPRASMRVLGMYRPIRLLPKARGLWENSCVFNGGRARAHVKVLGLRRVGMREVVAMETTSKTLVCEGLLSHNSQVARYAYRYVQVCMPMAISGFGAIGCLAGVACTMPDGTAGITKCMDIYELADSDLASIVSHEGRLYMRYPRVPWAPSSAGKANLFGVTVTPPPSTWSGAGVTTPASIVMAAPPPAVPPPPAMDAPDVQPAQASIFGPMGLAAAGAAAGYFGFEWLKRRGVRL